MLLRGPSPACVFSSNPGDPWFNPTRPARPRRRARRAQHSRQVYGNLPPVSRPAVFSCRFPRLRAGGARYGVGVRTGHFSWRREERAVLVSHPKRRPIFVPHRHPGQWCPRLAGVVHIFCAVLRTWYAHVFAYLLFLHRCPASAKRCAAWRLRYGSPSPLGDGFL
jgi:hypothetical protein